MKDDESKKCLKPPTKYLQIMWSNSPLPGALQFNLAVCAKTNARSTPDAVFPFSSLSMAVWNLCGQEMDVDFKDLFEYVVKNICWIII